MPEPAAQLLVSAAVTPDKSRFTFLVLSALFCKVVKVSVKVLLVNVCVPVKVTTVESIEIIPVVVTGPPVKPVPVLTWVTVPDAADVSQEGMPPRETMCWPAEPIVSFDKVLAAEA
jgi:hypothetical protein